MTGRILVVGGAGYIGGYLVDLIKMSTGHNVTVYDSLLYEQRFLKQVDFVRGDVRDHDHLARVLDQRQFDAVVWLAALVGDAACAVDPYLTRSINLDPVVWLAKHFNGRIVFTSTCSVYGVNHDLIDEYARPNPLSVYAETKLAAEQALLQTRPDSLVFRLGTLFGLGDEHSRVRFDLVANVLAKRAALKQPLIINGGEQWRPLLHVRDVARAILFGLNNNLSGLFNLAARNLTIRDLAVEILAVVPEAKVQYNDIPFEDLRNYKVKTQRIRATGWDPHYSVRDGVEEIVRIIEERRVRDLNDAVYSNAEFLRQARLVDIAG